MLKFPIHKGYDLSPAGKYKVILLQISFVLFRDNSTEHLIKYKPDSENFKGLAPSLKVSAWPYLIQQEEIHTHRLYLHIPCQV